MRAIVYDRYGPPEVLRLEEVDTPRPAADEVLVRVHVSSVNRSDAGLRAATPFFARAFTGLLRPRNRIVGSEFAGEVAAAGSAVTRFSIGDRVFGARDGANAEFVTVKESGAIATIPEGVSFEQAALCDGAILALPYLRRAGIGPESRLLIYGASGAIGTAAVQLAKHLGARVTAVCPTPTMELVRELGADVVIDHLQQDYSSVDDRFDAVFDAVGKSSFLTARRVLVPGGRYLVTDLGRFAQNPLLALLTAPLSRLGFRRVDFPLPSYDRTAVEFVAGVLAIGALEAVIDRRYPLAEVVEATRYVETQQKVGNVVITVVP